MILPYFKPGQLGYELEEREPTIEERLRDGLPDSCFIRRDTLMEFERREEMREIFKGLFSEN